MGRGDKKSKKGKISKGSFGVSRNRKAIHERIKRVTSKKKVVESEHEEKPKKTAKKKADA